RGGRRGGFWEHRRFERGRAVPFAVCDPPEISVRSASGKRAFADRINSARTRRGFPADSLPNIEQRRQFGLGTPGMKTSITCLCLISASCCCYATGGDSNDYPAKLSDTLSILPAKSLGEIFLETSTIHPPTASWDPTKLRELADRIGKEPLPKLLKAAEDLIAQARASYKP